MSKRGRLWIGFAGCLLLFCAAVAGMTLRIAEFNRTADFARFNAKLVPDREFQIPGFPPVSLTDVRVEDLDQAESELFPTDAWGAFLRLQYGDRSLLIPVRSPPVDAAPNLAIYDEWVKVMAITEMHRSSASGDSEPTEGSQRLLIVTRTTPPGYDPASWGSVRRSEWVFTFYNLRPDGSIEVEKRRWPRKRRGELTLKQLAADAEVAGSVEQARYRELAAIEPLGQRTVEYFAAMHVIPKLNVPAYKFNDTAFSFGVLGWTAPAAGLSVLGMLYTFVFAIGPRVRSAAQPSDRA